MDEFKKYLRDHRPLLDVESPPRSEVWQRIQQNSPVRRKPVLKPVFRWVAAACMVVVAGASIYFLWDNKPATAVSGAEPRVEVKQPIPEITGRTDSLEPAISPLPGEVIADKAGEKMEKTSTPALSKRRKDMRPALSKKAPAKKRTLVEELQDSYASIISLQLKKLESTPIHVESAGYFHAFKKQWYDMEKDEKKLKDDIKLYGLNDAVLEQFIQLYQQKLLLLKQLQDEINKMNNRAQQYPEIQRKSPSFLKM